MFVRFACSYVDDDAVAEDIVMESAMAFWVKKDSLTPDVNIPAYILTSIKNKSLNYLQSKIARSRAQGDISEVAMWELETRISTLESFNPDEVFTAEIQSIVAKTMAAMPEQTRKVFVLSRYENKKNKEIASRLNISEKGVEYHITQALKILRLALADYLTVSIALFFLG